MAKIISPKGKEVEIKDGSEIKGACERLGVHFSCCNGNCGSCMIDILDGAENLSELTDAEKLFVSDKKHRLACQCKIKSGNVKIDF